MRYTLSIATLACALCIPSVRLCAADIYFDRAVTSTGLASDFQFSGTLDRAYAFDADHSLEINGITFTPFAPSSAGDNTDLDQDYAFRGNGGGDAYDELLRHGLSHAGSARTISFTNLAPNKAYTIELVASGLRAKTDCCSAGAGYTNLFVYNRSVSPDDRNIEWNDGVDSTSRLIYGTFTSDPDGTQIVNLNLNPPALSSDHHYVAQIHGVVLSYSAVPEPASFMLLSLAGFGVTITRRRR